MILPVFAQVSLAGLTSPPSLEVGLRTAEQNFPVRTRDLKIKNDSSKLYAVICTTLSDHMHTCVPERGGNFPPVWSCWCWHPLCRARFGKVDVVTQL